MDREYRVNNRIKEVEVQLVLPDGNMMGTIPIRQALEKAEEFELDLVEVSPRRNDQAAVCKIIDYGKLKYDQSKKHKQPRPHSVKEIHCNFRISDHDLEIKNKKVRQLLEKKHQVRYYIELRGREKGMVDQAMEKISGSLSSFADLGTWNKPQVVNGGKRMTVSTVISPR